MSTRQFDKMVSPDTSFCSFISDREKLKGRIDAAFEVLLNVHGEDMTASDAEMTANAVFIIDVVRDVAMALTGLDVTFRSEEEKP